MSDDTGGLFPTFGGGAKRVSMWRGWRKVAIVILAVILVVGVIDAAGTIYEGGKVRAKLAELKAQGVAVSWKELIPKPVPDAENGAKLYLQAADLIKAREAKRAGGYDSKDWRDAAKMAVVAKYVAEDADALALVKEAAAKPYAWFNLNWSDPPATQFPHLAKMRNLARFVGSAAVVASMRGDQAEALEDMRVGFVMSRHVCPEPTLIDQLVCYAMDAIMVSAAEMVIGKGPLPEDKARALAGELGRIDYTAGLDQAMQMERCFGIYMFDQVRRDPKLAQALSGPEEPGGNPQPGWFWWAHGYLLRPLTYADEQQYLKVMDRTSERLRMPAAERAASREAEKLERPGAPWYAVLTRILLPVFGRVSVKRDQTIAERALVGAAMGVEMYKQKVGRYPEGLDEVRQMGWKVAEDPFSGGELKYRKVGETYLMYSVGMDLKDDGGKPLAYQLKALGRATGEEGAGAGEKDKGDIVWLGTWEKAAGG